MDFESETFLVEREISVMAHGQGGAEIARERRTTLTCNHESPIAFIPHELVSTLDANYGKLQGCSGQDANHGHSHLVPVGYSTSGDGYWRDGIVALRGREQDSHENLAVTAAGAESYGIPGNCIGRAPENGGNATEPMENIAPCLTTADRHAVAYRTAGDGTVYEEGDVTPPLTTNTDQCANVIAFSCKDHGADAADNIAPTMRAMNSVTGNQDAGGQLAIAFAENSRGEIRMEGGDGQRTGALSTGGGKPGQCMPVVCITGDITHTLKADGFDASEDGTGRGTPLVAAVAFRGRAGGASAEIGADVGFTLRAAQGGSDKAHVIQNMAVRRLIPVECERLQAFEDEYTNIPIPSAKVRKQKRKETDEAYAKYCASRPVKYAADGPRYKALGNSMCVNNMRFIGERIQMFNGDK